MTEEAPTVVDAYSLLSKPTLELTDAELAISVADLRSRRKFYLAGKADRPDKPPAAKPTEASKADATKEILAGLALKLPGM